MLPINQGEGKMTALWRVVRGVPVRGEKVAEDVTRLVMNTTRKRKCVVLSCSRGHPRKP
jgi:hypothetical protein